jgi:hypothetical protein
MAIMIRDTRVAVSLEVRSAEDFRATFHLAGEFPADDAKPPVTVVLPLTTSRVTPGYSLVFPA